MMETLTAAAISQSEAAKLIAKLVFDGAIQAGAGKLTEAAIEKAKQLWQRILRKVKEEGVTEATLVAVSTQKSFPIFEQQVVPFVHTAMLKDTQFAHQIQHIAQQINQEIIEGSQDSISLKANAYDQSTVKQVGKIQAERVSF